MLNAYPAPTFSCDDRVLFDRLVPYDHWTRRADARVDFLALRQSIEHHFSVEGRPAVEPILCRKLELIMFHDGLFTAINVLPADGNESADTLTLLEQEEGPSEVGASAWGNCEPPRRSANPLSRAGSSAGSKVDRGNNSKRDANASIAGQRNGVRNPLNRPLRAAREQPSHLLKTHRHMTEIQPPKHD